MRGVEQGYVIMVEGLPIIVTHKRVKNVNMRIGADGLAHLSAPLGMSRVQVEQVARDHATWFDKHLAKASERRKDGPLRWETGETLMVWGKSVRLDVQDTGLMPSCSLKDDVLVIDAPALLPSESRMDLVERWLVGQLKEEVERIAPSCEEKVGRRARSITLRRMKTRWGSCTVRTGAIRLNTALAECPVACTTMVLLHELCHLREPNHGNRFHALMDLVCPDWRATQRWLDEHPPRVLSVYV